LDRKKITKQSLTDDEYLHLLGICQWVFNSNSHFIIEMIDQEHHGNSMESWHKLTELTAGQLKDHKNLVVNILSQDIYDCFNGLVEMRNSIMHSFPTGNVVDGYNIAVYKDKSDKQIEIDKNYLRHFISQNETLSGLIHAQRGC